MKAVQLMLFAFFLCWILPSASQTSTNRVLANHLSHQLLMRLANPKDTEYRVEVINTAAEFSALVSPEGALPVAQYFRGYSTARNSTWQLSWVAEEVLESSMDELNFEVIRKGIGSDTCPNLVDATASFYRELNGALSAPIPLSTVPPKSEPETITLDGTSYVLQIWTGERTLVIYPDRDIDFSLDKASAALLREVSGCSNGLPGVIEEHYGW